MKPSSALRTVCIIFTLVLLAGGVLAQQPAASPVALTPEERRWLDDHRGSIILTYDENFPPIEFRDVDGHYAGMGAEIVARVEALLGVTFVKLPTSDWGAFLKDLEAGNVHLNGGMASTPERDEYAFCTAPYIKLPLAIITRAKGFEGRNVAWEDLKGKRVAVVSGYMTESYVRRHSQGEFSVVVVPSIIEGLRDVSFGVVDAFVDNLATSSYYIEKEALTNLRVAGNTDLSFPISLCVSRKYPLLLSSLQKALDAIPASEVEALRKRWISLSGGGLLEPETRRQLKFAGVFVLLLLLGLGGISYLLKRRLDEKVCSLGAARKELEEQTERLHMALDAISAGVWEYHPLTGALFCTDQWYSMLGRDPGSLEGDIDVWRLLLHPDDQPGAMRAVNAYCASDGRSMYEAEFRMLHADGTWRWVLGKGRAVAWDGQGRPSRIVGLNIDIHELKTMQEDLRRSEAIVRAAFDQTFQFCTLLDTNGKVVRINKSALSFSNITPDAVIGRHFGDCPWWPDRETAHDIMRQAVETALSGGVFRREVQLQDAAGSVAQVDFSLSPLMESDGSVNILIAEGRDLSAIRRAEQALKASEERYRAIFSNAPVGIFRSTYSGRVVDVNQALAAMHGFQSPEEMLRGMGDLAFEAYASSEDRWALLRGLEDTPRGLRMEITLKRFNGETFPAIINASLQYGPEGEPAYLDGVIEDITERKRAEATLREKTALLEAMVDATLDGILVVGEGREVLVANRRFCEMFSVPAGLRQGRVDDMLLRHVACQAPTPEAFTSRVAELSLDPLCIAREEENFVDGKIVDRYTAPITGEDGKLYGRIWMFRDITDRKALELRVADQLAFQEALLDTIPYAVFYKGRDTRFVGCNRAYEQCFGIRREMFIGKRVLDLDYLPMADRQAFQAEDEAVIDGLTSVSREVAIPFADGMTHQALYSVSGFRLSDGSSGGLIGIIVDMTERKMAEERFSLIFEMAPECIFFIRVSDMTLVDTNVAFESMTGFSREEVLGRSMADLGLWNDPNDRAVFLKRLEDDGDVKNFEFMLRRKDGEIRRVTNSSRLVNIAGESCYISILHDITETRRMQELLIQSEKMMSIGSLAAGIAHEINNPLGIVHQAVQNLIQRTNPEQRKNIETAQELGLDMGLLQQYIKARKLDVFLADIQTAAVRASGIIRSMLNFSRRSESRRSVCDLPRIIEQSLFLASSDYDLKKAFDFKRIEIVLDLETDLPACDCTETELEQVILNLLRNAAQAMAMAPAPDRRPRITIRLRLQDDVIRLEVEDNGPGMGPHIQRKIFEPFFTTKPPGIGTGLGLAVSYFIITKGHGGKMWVESAPGQGATFFIELPVDKRGNADG
ncbi:MAG: PAS domain S-box protein [Desulfovibrio sp.]|nr:PAS domain S-box protein [Desulfovibrio sp.]